MYQYMELEDHAAHGHQVAVTTQEESSTRDGHNSVSNHWRLSSSRKEAKSQTSSTIKHKSELN